MLNDEVERGTGGRLNPMWVAWLMGTPIGWTSFEHSETESSRRWSEWLGTN